MTHRCHCLVFRCLLLMCLVSQTEAQSQSAPSPNAKRVRLVDIKTGRAIVTGALEGWVGDTMIVVPDSMDGRAQRFAVGSGRRLEHSVGMQSRAGEGFALGALMGAIAGALLSTTLYDRPDCRPDGGYCPPDSRASDMLDLAGLMAFPGALLGAISGSNTLRETWQAAPADRMRLAVSPMFRGGFRLSAAVSF